MTTLTINHLGYAINLTAQVRPTFKELSATKKSIVLDLMQVGYVILDENDRPKLTEIGFEEVKVATACFAGAGK